MMFTEQDLINAFKANMNNKGWIYLVGNPESKAQFIIDYMKEHKEPINEDKLDELPKSSWVKCSERMPDWNDKTFDGYLVRTTVPTKSQGKNTVFTAVYFDGKFVILGDKNATQKITHWMPIPKLEEE